MVPLNGDLGGICPPGGAEARLLQDGVDVELPPEGTGKDLLVNVAEVG